jgi:hypothetical protein
MLCIACRNTAFATEEGPSSHIKKGGVDSQKSWHHCYNGLYPLVSDPSWDDPENLKFGSATWMGACNPALQHNSFFMNCRLSETAPQPGDKRERQLTEAASASNAAYHEDII